ncbi:MAG: hypothetical protein WB723_08490 [Candidatus Acidiferrales bacterium]
MKKIVAAIAVAFILLVLIFVKIGGSFDRQFWLTFVPGLMENLAVLALAVLVLDRIFSRERYDKLEQTNASRSKFVFFLSNQLAYVILKHLALATDADLENDSELNFGFAYNKLRATNLPAVFYEKLIATDDRRTFVACFTKLLTDRWTNISKALESIYPRPHPVVDQLLEQLNRSSGSLYTFGEMFGMIAQVNAKGSVKEQLKPEHVDVIIAIAYESIGRELHNIQTGILELAERAKNNCLFLPLE